MSTVVLDERTVSCDDENDSDALGEARVMIEDGEFAIDPEDLF